jgi:hypothetical protein
MDDISSTLGKDPPPLTGLFAIRPVQIRFKLTIFVHRGIFTDPKRLGKGLNSFSRAINSPRLTAVGAGTWASVCALAILHEILVPGALVRDSGST